MGGVDFVFTKKANNEACIVGVNFDKEVKKIVFPAVVKESGRKFVVTEISGEYTHFAVTDRRRKDYGSHIIARSIVGYIFSQGVWKNVKEIQLPKTLKKIGPCAFYQLPVKSIVIPKGVEEIGRSAFECSKLEGTIVIPSKMKKIGDYAFNCTPKITLEIKNDEGTVTFGCSALGSNDEVKYVGKGFFSKLFGK